MKCKICGQENGPLTKAGTCYRKCAVITPRSFWKVLEWNQPHWKKTKQWDTWYYTDIADFVREQGFIKTADKLDAIIERFNLRGYLAV